MVIPTQNRSGRRGRSPLVTAGQRAATWETGVREKWKKKQNKKNTVADAADGQLEGTHVVLDVQVAAGFEQDAHNLDVAFVGGQVQRAAAILRRHNTERTRLSPERAHTHTQKKHPPRGPTEVAFTNPPTPSAASR